MHLRDRWWERSKNERRGIGEGKRTSISPIIACEEQTEQRWNAQQWGRSRTVTEGCQSPRELSNRLEFVGFHPVYPTGSPGGVLAFRKRVRGLFMERRRRRRRHS